MDVILPKVALTMTSAVILDWYHKTGEHVRAGEPLFSFETDKTAIDVDAPADGALAEIRVAAGEEALAGSVVAILDVAGEASERTVPAPKAERQVAPAARELAASLGVDLAEVTGTGTDGRVLEGDVIAAIARDRPTGAPPATTAAVGDEAVVPMPFSAARAATMATVERSVSVPTFHLGATLDFSPQWAVMQSRGVSVVDVLSVAAARALKAHPTCHTRVRDGRREAYRTPRIGVLLRLADALLPLVFDDPAEGSASEFRTRRKEAQEAASRGRVAMENASTPTFVISNLGPFGVEWFTAMLYPDTAMTLAVGAVGAPSHGPTEAAVVLTCDHRLVDGVDAAQFMQTLREELLGVRVDGEATE
jgi:pyruvate/2-oxoglutarate dehydrogenase complex dihydrolipoamide acyltransferase (E2) component